MSLFVLYLGKKHQQPETTEPRLILALVLGHELRGHVVRGPAHNRFSVLAAKHFGNAKVGQFKLA
jgi:hypothetical protein